MTLSAENLMATKTEYGLHLSDEIEKRMLRCHAPVRAAIKERLRQIALGAAEGGQRLDAVAPGAPPLRFYVYEGYRITYRLDAESRRVVVLDLELLPVE